MSIVITNSILPPDDKMELILCIRHDGTVVDPWGHQIDTKAIELPSHGRLGDLDKLDDAFTALRFNEDGSLNHWDDRKNWCLHGSEIEMLLANAPTIIPAEGGANDG